MPRCGHMFHDKCIQTCKIRGKSEPNYGVGPTMQKTHKEAALFFISRAGRSHAPMLRPSSSHELDNILISLEFPVYILFRVRRFHPYPRHFFNFYFTHGSPFSLVEELYTNTELFLFYIAVMQMLSYFDFLLSSLTWSQKKSLLKEIPCNLTLKTNFSKKFP